MFYSSKLQTTMAEKKLADLYRTMTANLEMLSKTTVALWFVVIMGVVSRILYVNVSLWLDEAWVANSVLGNSLSEMFYYDSWLQTSPPLFLLLVRYTVKVFGLSHATLRAVPILFGVLSILLIISLARQFFDKKYVLLCVTLLAINPTAIHHSLNLKQYSSDLFSTVILLVAMYRYLKTGDMRCYLFLLASFGVALLLSYTAIFWIPSAVYCLWRVWASKYTLNMNRKPLSSLWRLLLFVAFVAILSIVNYVVFIQPNMDHELVAFWSSGFPPNNTLFGVATFYVTKFTNLSGLFIPRSYLNVGLKTLISLTMLAGFTRLLIACCRQKESTFFSRDMLVIIVCLPFLTLIGANLIGKYPYGITKLNFFILPVLLILFVYGVIAYQNILQWILQQDLDRKIGYSIQSVCVFSAVAVFYLLTVSNSVSASRIVIEDPKGAVEYLRYNMKPEDSLYVHASMVEQFKIYCRLLNCDNIAHYYGSTGAPCCSRDKNLEGNADAYALQSDFKSFMSYRRSRRKWFLFSDRGHWNYVGRNEAQIIESRLAKMGCEEAGRKRRRGVLIHWVDCN